MRVVPSRLARSLRPLTTWWCAAVLRTDLPYRLYHGVAMGNDDALYFRGHAGLEGDDTAGSIDPEQPLIVDIEWPAFRRVTWWFDENDQPSAVLQAAEGTELKLPTGSTAQLTGIHVAVAPDERVWRRLLKRRRVASAKSPNYGDARHRARAVNAGGVSS